MVTMFYLIAKLNKYIKVREGIPNRTNKWLTSERF